MGSRTQDTVAEAATPGRRAARVDGSEGNKRQALPAAGPAAGEEADGSAAGGEAAGGSGGRGSPGKGKAADKAKAGLLPQPRMVKPWAAAAEAKRQTRTMFKGVMAAAVGN